MSLERTLQEWADSDVAAFELGRAIGLFDGTSFAADAKDILWSSNELGDGLHDALLGLTRAGVLERRDEPDEQFRWRAPTP